VVELTSDARRQADVIRGEADAERNRILAEAYGRDTEFFGFIRSLTAYETSLKGSNSSIVMQPDSEFFTYLRSAGVIAPDGAAPEASPEASPEAAPVDPAAAPASP
jgi:modulator of FtsH protease HflC